MFSLEQAPIFYSIRIEDEKLNDSMYLKWNQQHINTNCKIKSNFLWNGFFIDSVECIYLLLTEI